MAEVVSFHMEDMIPELEHMKRLKLYTNDEISIMMKRRKEYEYKIRSKRKEKQDFLRYINYEVKLLRDIKLRRDKHNRNEKKNEIEYTIAKRVVKLYNQVISYFKSDESLWMSYINFCTQIRFGNVVTEAFKEFLQVHGDKSHLWLYAAKWELEEANNVAGALNYVITGLHRHPNSSELYQQAFHLELLAAKHKQATDIEISEDELQRKAVQHAQVHFNQALKTNGNNNVKFIVSLLKIASKFNFTITLQNEIIDYLRKNCWRCVEMWDAMAQRELYNDKNEIVKRVKVCLSIYKAGVKALPTQEMWEKYLERLVEIHKDEEIKVELINNVLSAFQEAYEAKVLQEKHFLIWIELFENDPKRLEVLELATKALPSSVELWLCRLKNYITNNVEEKVDQVFQEAVAALGKKAFPIYIATAQYFYFVHEDFKKVRDIYTQGIESYPEISLPLRPKFIEWINLTKTTKTARLEYDRLVNLTPYCIELHNKMVELELGKININVMSLRNIYKLATVQLGADNVDVWINFMRFEMKYGDASSVPSIYQSAKNMLNPELMSKFTTDYAIFNTTCT